jgi:hypothetical protein
MASSDNTRALPTKTTYFIRGIGRLLRTTTRLEFLEEC